MGKFGFIGVFLLRSYFVDIVSISFLVGGLFLSRFGGVVCGFFFRFRRVRLEFLSVLLVLLRFCWVWIRISVGFGRCLR